MIGSYNIVNSWRWEGNVNRWFSKRWKNIPFPYRNQSLARSTCIHIFQWCFSWKLKNILRSPCYLWLVFHELSIAQWKMKSNSILVSDQLEFHAPIYYSHSDQIARWSRIKQLKAIYLLPFETSSSILVRYCSLYLSDYCHKNSSVFNESADVCSISIVTASSKDFIELMVFRWDTPSRLSINTKSFIRLNVVLGWWLNTALNSMLSKVIRTLPASHLYTWL